MINTLNKYSRRSRAYDTDVTFVQGDLAVTPAEMSQASKMGIPISSNTVSSELFDDGEIGRMREVPFLYRRGVEIGDVFAHQQDCQSKVSNYVNSQKSE